MKTWTLDTCGLLSLFVVHFMWCVLNLKTRKTVNICIIWRQQIKGLYAIGLCRPPSPGFPRRDGTMSWHFTFHFECSSCGPINPEKKKKQKSCCGRFIFFLFFLFLGFWSFSDTPDPICRAFPLQSGYAYRCSCSGAYCPSLSGPSTVPIPTPAPAPVTASRAAGHKRLNWLKRRELFLEIVTIIWTIR